MSGLADELRVVFMGTAELAAVSLRALAAHSHITILAVVTQPDRPKGRKLKLAPSPVKMVAEALGLPVLQPVKARDPSFLQALADLSPDLGVVAAYGQILPSAVLATPRLGCMNVHTSLLPKYRGAAPIQWAILDDEPETGVTLMRMDAGLDTGPMLAQARTPIREDDDAVTLHDRLASMGADLLLSILPAYVSGQLVPEPQDDARATYARKITKLDGRVDWSRPARSIWNQIRGLIPWPGAYTQVSKEGQSLLLKLWKAEIVTGKRGDPGVVISGDESGLVVGCGQDSLRILELQIEGGKRLSWQAFRAGHAWRAGEILGDTAHSG